MCQTVSPITHVEPGAQAEPRCSPADGTPAPTSQRAVTIDEIVEHFGTLRSVLQRWHEAYRRMHGGPAGDPSRGQGRALALLNMQGEMRQRDMGFILNIRPQSLGEVLAKLERSGLITRRTSEKDRRVLLVSITEKGRACVRSCKPPFPDVDLSDEELEQFSSMLERIIRAFEGDTARLNSAQPRTGGETGLEDTPRS